MAALGVCDFCARLVLLRQDGATQRHDTVGVVIRARTGKRRKRCRGSGRAPREATSARGPPSEEFPRTSSAAPPEGRAATHERKVQQMSEQTTEMQREKGFLDRDKPLAPGQEPATDESKPFDTDDFGQTVIPKARVVFYGSCGGWEVDIIAPDGSAVGFDIAPDALAGKGELARHLGARLTDLGQGDLIVSEQSSTTQEATPCADCDAPATTSAPVTIDVCENHAKEYGDRLSDRLTELRAEWLRGSVGATVIDVSNN